MTDPASPWSPLADSERRVVLELLVHGPLARTELADRLRLSACLLYTSPSPRDA